MLEGLVAGLLNRFIGPYVTNLDVSQLNIAIWSGMFLEKNKTESRNTHVPFHTSLHDLGQAERRLLFLTGSTR